MKNLKKVLAVMTAVASLCMSATAFAETKTEAVVSGVSNGGVAGLTGTFTHATSVLSVQNPNTVKADTETTILVLTEDATTVTEGMIMYINQQNSTTDGKDFSNMGLKLPTGVTALPGSAEGTSYPIRVGYYTEAGDFAIAKGAIVVTTSEVGGKTIKFVFGDVNEGEYTGTATTDMSKVNDADALAIIKAANGDSKAKGGIANIGTVLTTSDGKKFVFGDVNEGEYTGTATTDMSKVNDADALAIIKAANGDSKAKGGVANIGTVVEVKVAE